MQHLISANIRFLDQAERLLHQLGDTLYATPVESFYGSTVGQHLRHCLDHYHSFLVMVMVDYSVAYAVMIFVDWNCLIGYETKFINQNV